MIPVNRASNGHRRYSEADIDWINLLNRMRLTGMPLDQIWRYSTLLRLGEGSFPERQAILTAYRTTVQHQIAALLEMLAFIDYKLTIYDKAHVKKEE